MDFPNARPDIHQNLFDQLIVNFFSTCRKMFPISKRLSNYDRLVLDDGISDIWSPLNGSSSYTRNGSPDSRASSGYESFETQADSKAESEKFNNIKKIQEQLNCSLDYILFSINDCTLDDVDKAVPSAYSSLSSSDEADTSLGSEVPHRFFGKLPSLLTLSST